MNEHGADPRKTEEAFKAILRYCMVTMENQAFLDELNAVKTHMPYIKTAPDNTIELGFSYESLGLYVTITATVDEDREPETYLSRTPLPPREPTDDD